MSLFSVVNHVDLTSCNIRIIVVVTILVCMYHTTYSGVPNYLVSVLK